MNRGMGDKKRESLNTGEGALCFKLFESCCVLIHGVKTRAPMSWVPSVTCSIDITRGLSGKSPAVQNPTHGWIFSRRPSYILTPIFKIGMIITIVWMMKMKLRQTYPDQRIFNTVPWLIQINDCSIFNNFELFLYQEDATWLYMYNVKFAWG